jgi:D-alanyl-lipoteichoic acid acyltransferase DltB (MBOAT superfamily)
MIVDVAGRPAGIAESDREALHARSDDVRHHHARPHVAGFLVLAVQFVALVWILRAFQIEERALLRLMGLACGGFLVHYWLPFRYKEPFWIALSLLGAGVLLGALPALVLLLVGLAFYGVLASPATYRSKVMLMAVAALALSGLRTAGVPGVPAAVWPVLGSLFMFRAMIYVYDLRHAKGRPSLREYLAYFYPLPNFYFLLFPVIDFQTQRRTYYQRDIHQIAQQGLLWMLRGVVQLLLYRLVYFLSPSFTVNDVTSFTQLVVAMVGTYLLYLRVSGQFHVIVGLMHMFGYDLPETHRRYLLARSLTDFWRRINIYWKDFMVKLVYFPVYFRLRRSGEVRAQVVATAGVFTVTWALHAYQWYWLRGELHLTWPDTLFWLVLGLLVIVNLLVERARPARRHAGVWSWRMALGRGLHVLGTFSLIVVLWSLWNSSSVAEWAEVMTSWRGDR